MRKPSVLPWHSKDPGNHVAPLFIFLIFTVRYWTDVTGRRCSQERRRVAWLTYRLCSNFASARCRITLKVSYCGCSARCLCEQTTWLLLLFSQHWSIPVEYRTTFYGRFWSAPPPSSSTRWSISIHTCSTTRTSSGGYCARRSAARAVVRRWRAGETCTWSVSPPPPSSLLIDFL